MFSAQFYLIFRLRVLFACEIFRRVLRFTARYGSAGSLRKGKIAYTRRKALHTATYIDRNAEKFLMHAEQYPPALYANKANDSRINLPVSFIEYHGGWLGLFRSRASAGRSGHGCPL